MKEPTMLRALLAASAAALLALPAQGAVILTFGQIGAGNTITATANAGGTATTRWPAMKMATRSASTAP
jgi:hypothetical protein